VTRVLLAGGAILLALAVVAILAIALKEAVGDRDGE
jgi:hypothetical protein